MSGRARRGDSGAL